MRRRGARVEAADLALFAGADFAGAYNFGALVGNQLSHMGVWCDFLAGPAPFAVVLQVRGNPGGCCPDGHSRLPFVDELGILPSYH